MRNVALGLLLSITLSLGATTAANTRPLLCASCNAYAVSVFTDGGTVRAYDADGGTSADSAREAVALTRVDAPISGGPTPAPTGFAESFVSASLASGEIHAYAEGINGGGRAQATLFDTLVFDMPTGVNSATITLDWGYDGYLGSGARMYGSFYFGPDDAPPSGVDVVNILDQRLWNRTGEYLTDGDYAFDFSRTITVYADTRYQIQSVINLQAASDSESVLSKADFSHTSAFNFGLPSGVTFRSGSGVLLSALDPVDSSVPEPSIWAAMVTGFALLGGELRRRRLGLAKAP